MAHEEAVLPDEDTSTELQLPEQKEKTPTITWRAWRKSRYFPAAVFLILFLLVATGLFYFFRHIGTLVTDPQQAAEEEKQQVIAAVGRLMFLPEGEEPTVATVTDLAPLQNQPFFDRATLGDKVLVYTNARKAILYNPDENKIVDVTPLDFGNQNP